MSNYKMIFFLCDEEHNEILCKKGTYVKNTFKSHNTIIE